MSEALNEFAINLPMTGVGAVGSIATEPPCDVTANIAIPKEVSPTQCDHISVYVDQATVTNYDQNNPCVCVDIVLSIGVNNPQTGSGSTYKMVKRISFDKIKLALQAETMTPVQVVESEKEDDPIIVEQENATYAAVLRARSLAGIYESNGKLEATVLFKYVDKDGANCSGSVVYKYVENKAHARHIFDAKIDKTRFPDAKIVRVTLKDPAEKKD